MAGSLAPPFRLNAHSISNVRISEQQSRWSGNIPSGTGTRILSWCCMYSADRMLRAQNPDSDRIVTFTLLNNRTARSQRPRDEECFFQCGLEITAHADEACFLEYPDRFDISLDEEEQSLRLLFSHLKTFAIGHGCAANWDGGTADAVSLIRTESLPSYEIKPIVPTQIEGLDLSMLALATPGPESIGLCQPPGGGVSELDH